MDALLNLNPKTRKYLYHIAASVFGLLGLYGVLGVEELDTWLAVIVAVLGIGSNELAAKNTPADELEEDDAL